MHCKLPHSDFIDFIAHHGMHFFGAADHEKTSPSASSTRNDDERDVVCLWAAR
jgi:hypothetical protein